MNSGTLGKLKFVCEKLLQLSFLNSNAETHQQKMKKNLIQVGTVQNYCPTVNVSL